ncbi:transposase (IS4 family protein) [Desulforapulum autotrophicum HRM2]|uniref:Transposase (IS4 family protein) n=1 Tax=Desulforapulum autotrophicum (strain ATCC 43914 / DSM 3382 / VKM B-1955 / HRM2) TaxID=177437 RepID=C0QGY5_DESAH|nr:IS4 family transposase [Desulforapulum autotrophicum]ACN15634.1 transposase (IS4 family protein) [Desulforapulum autotrophicum HRM2]
MLNKSGITKTKGASLLELFTIVFNLAFVGKNLFEGVVRNKKIGVGKDAVYDFLNSPRYNWRRFTLFLCSRIYILIKNLLDNSSEEVLIIDDSTYDRSRSKKVELLSKVYDHCTGRYLKGFRMLTLGWSDGNSFLGIDFALLSSKDEKNRYNEINPKIDKRTCGYKRRKEAITKSTELLEPMVKRAINLGIRAKYLVMDSWFSMPSAISTLRKHIHVICMLKDQWKWFYTYNGKKFRLSDLYGKLKKQRGPSQIKASVIVTLSDGNKARIIFVSCDTKRGWLAVLSTDVSIAEEEILRLYGKRWDIEVFFKMCKQHLKLVKEIQIRNYDCLIGHTSLVIARYNILSLFQREGIDQRSFGDIFRACNEELTNITFIEALKRIIQLATATLRKAHKLSDKVITAMFDVIMGQAAIYFGLSDNKRPQLAGVLG